MLNTLLAEIVDAPPTLNLFPTENRLSPAALALLGSELVARYPGSEGDGYLYGDPLDLGRLYTECARLAGEYFAARHGFVQFLSGLHAMQAVITTACRAGDHVVVMDPTCGGHYATETICRDLGLSVDHLPFDRGQLAIDTDALVELVDRRPPRFVYVDLSTSLRIPDVTAIRAAIGPDPILCFDASHLLGLLPAVYDPGEFWRAVDLCSASTHKTFPGPQKAIVLTDRDAMADLVAGRLPFRVSSGHTNSVAALAVTLSELLPSRVAYARTVVANARALAEAFVERGFDVPGKEFGFTETHQVWIVPSPEEDPVEWGRRLRAAGIRVTVVGLPATGRPGLRLGVQELTRVGMRPAQMAAVADLVRDAFAADRDLASVRARVTELATRFATVHTAFAG